MILALVLGGTIILLVLVVVRLARRLGRRSAEADAAGRSLERSRDALEIDEDVARLTNDELDRELRDSTTD